MGVAESYRQSLGRFFFQLWIMLKRNTVLQVRYRRSTVSQVFVGPIVFFFLLWILQKASNANLSKAIWHPKSYPVNGVQTCWGTSKGQPCISLMFAPPSDERVSKIMKIFAKYNGERIGDTWNLEPAYTDTNALPSSVLGMVPVANGNFIYNYAIKNPNVTKFAVEFTISDTPTNVQYEIWTNSTITGNATAGDVFGEEVISLVRTLDEAIITHYNDPAATSPTNIKLTAKDWPKVPPAKLVDTIVSSLGAMFFFCSEMIIFINVLSTIVTEKELHLKHGMEMMGLQPLVYWVSWYISNFLLVVVCSLVTVVLGHIFRFTVFTDVNFMISWITFILFGIGMVSAAFAITAVVRQAKLAVLIGIFIFIIGLLFQSFVFARASLGYIWWDPSTDPAIWKVLIMLPFFNFGKIFALDMNLLTTGTYDSLTDTYVSGPGFGWDDMYRSIDVKTLVSVGGGKPTPPPPIDSWNYLFMNAIVYFVLALYLDQVIPDEYGNARKPWFLFTPSFWGLQKRATREPAEWLAQVRKSGKKLEVPAGEDPAVAAERQAVIDLSIPAACRIVNLRKIYRQSIFASSPLDKVAVKNTCLRLESGKLLALLGSNGAGKSTTIGILSGLSPASSGDALFFDKYSVVENMPTIRSMMGICPQHDILFNDLTAREHINLYCGLKGVPREEIPKIMEERLKALQLWKVVDNRAGTYSGGMKRRLSMLISTLGDPRIIFLDEPTTGMDPVNRRHVWTFVENFKKNRIIILTTHSMEEADILGDRIAIMASGQIRGLGTSIVLKNKFGAGYRFSLITSSDDASTVKEIVKEKVPGATLEDDSAGGLIYQFPNESVMYIPAFVRWIEEEDKGKLVQSFGVSQTTLEEVFLNLIRTANSEGSSDDKNKEQ